LPSRERAAVRVTIGAQHARLVEEESSTHDRRNSFELNNHGMAAL